MDYLPHRAKHYVRGCIRDTLLISAATNFSTTLYLTPPRVMGIFYSFLIVGLLIFGLYWGYQALAAIISGVFWILTNIVELAATAIIAVFSSIIWIPTNIVAAIISTVNYIAAASVSTVNRILPDTAAAAAAAAAGRNIDPAINWLQLNTPAAGKGIVAAPTSDVDNIFVTTISSVVRFVDWASSNIIAIVYLLIVCCFWIIVASLLFTALKAVLKFLRRIFIGMGEKWEQAGKSPLRARFERVHDEGHVL